MAPLELITVPAKANCIYCHAEIDKQQVVTKSGIITEYFMPCECETAQTALAEKKKRKAEAERKKKQEEKKKRYEMRRRRLLGESGIKKRFLSRTFETFEVDSTNQKAYKISKEYVDRFDELKEKGYGLFFSGGFGTGKTHLAVAIALALIDKGYSVVLMTSLDMLKYIRSSYDKEGPTERDVLSIYKNADLLIIDDLGKEYGSEWAVTQMYQIINERYESMLPVIITTNYTDNELMDRLGERGRRVTSGAIISRLREMTGAVKMRGKDRRSA